MKATRTRGFAVLELIGVLVAGAALIGALTMLVHTVIVSYEKERSDGYAAGVADTQAADTARTNARLAAVNARLVALQADRDMLEEKLRTANKTIADLANEEKQRANNEASSTLADLDTGALVLRDGIVELVSGCPAGPARGAAGAPGASAGGDPCKPRYRFSKAAEGVLVGTARDGELSAGNLAACLAITDSDRALINKGAAP